jgi:PAS domain-containing protein
MSVRKLSLLCLLLVVLTALCAALWSFGLEDLLDPYLPGEHAVENDAERWEFVIATTLLVALSAGLVLLFGLRALKASESRQRVEALVYQGFLNDPQAAFATDGERNVIAENDRCRALLGPHFGTLLGRSFHELLPIDLTDTRYLALEIGLRDHSHWRGEFVVRGRQGEVCIQLELVMLQSASGVASSLHGRVHALETVDASPRTDAKVA